MIGGVPGPGGFKQSYKGMMDVCEETPACSNLLGGNLDSRMENAINEILSIGQKNECQEEFLVTLQSKPTNLVEFGYKIRSLFDHSFISGLAAIILSLECDFPSEYINSLTDIKAALELRKSNIKIFENIALLVYQIVNSSIAEKPFDIFSKRNLHFHNRWSPDITIASSFTEQRNNLESELTITIPAFEQKEAKSSVTPVFQFQGMLDFITSYEEAGETFNEMKVPLKASLLFRNYGHPAPDCDAMNLYYAMWFKLPRNVIMGMSKLYTILVKKCDGLKQIPWDEKIRAFLPKDYALNGQGWQSNYVPPSFFDCKREMILADGERGQIDCSEPIHRIGMHRMAAYQTVTAY